MKNILILLAFTVFISCRKEQITHYEATLINKSTRNISLVFYYSNLLKPTDTIKLVPNMPFLYGRGFDRGLNYVPGFNSFYPYEDSLVVIYDNVFKVSHYGNTPTNLNRKHYLFASLRNMGNPKSYRLEITKLSKQSIKKEHFYEFTEADFLFASQ